MNAISKIITTATILFFIATAFLLYQNLGRDYLYDWDEGIYAELGRELSHSNLLTPTWNSQLWLEKPPLIAWVAGLGQRLVTDPELGSRLLIPVFTLITLISVYYIGRRLSTSSGGLVSAGILLSFDLFLSRSRTLNTDIILLAGLTLALALILNRAKPFWVGTALALAIFAKGPAGLLALIITLPLLLTKSKNYALYTIYYVLLFTLPWHLYQYLVHGSDFYTPYLLEQVIRRATVPIEFHLESRWYYFVQLYQDLGGGVLFVLALGLLALLLKHKYFLLYWIFLPLAIFTLAKTRLFWYILPIYPALALVLGSLLADLFVKIRAKYHLATVIFVLGIWLQSLLHLGSYIGKAETSTPLPDQLTLAKSISQKGSSHDTVAYLVSPSERTAEAILPASQRLTSSFRYGGSPSFVFYSQKNVQFYYNYDNFSQDLATNLHSFAIVSQSDTDKVPPNYKEFMRTDTYIGYTLEQRYAHR